MEIEELATSPTFQQAQQVIALNKQRNDQAIHPLRDLYSQRKGKLRAAKAPGGDMKAFDAWWAEQKTKEADLVKKAEEIEDQIYKINRPEAVKIEIKAAPPIAAKPKAPAKPQAAAQEKKAA